MKRTVSLYSEPTQDSKTVGGFLPQRLSGLRMLIVDDQRDIREVMCDVLGSEGARVDQVPNGFEATEAAFREPYDVILMDICMPVKSGLEVLCELRQKGYQGIVVAVTADATRDLQDKCMKAGFNAFISKPFGLDELVTKILRLLNPA